MPVSGGPSSLGAVSPSMGPSGGSDPPRGIAATGGGGGPLARHVKRKLAGLLDGWRRVKSFRLFLEPVDVERMECPTYYDVIKNPMDLRTMEAKLERDEYRSEEAFVADLLLIFRNCRTFNDEATPAGQFVLRLCAEAEARSLEDLKKACKDSKLWAALEQQFSHGKQKTGARQKGGGSSKRAASGLASASDSAAPAAAAAAAAAAAGAGVPASARPGATDSHPPPLSYDGAAGGVLGPSPGVTCMNGLMYTGSTAAGEEAATAAAAAAAEAGISEGVEGAAAASETVSDTTLQQTSTSAIAGISPPSNPLTPAASGSHRGHSQANWQGEGGALLGQGMLDMENCLTGKSWYIYCRDNILRPLKGDRYAYLFLTPVLDSPELPDAVKSSYKSVIARPMDYGTIWTKLTARDYHHPLEFFEDMFLVYSNCMAFNPPNDQQCGWLHRVAEKSRDKFVERWRRWVVRIWRAFAQHNAAAAAAAPPVLQHAEAAKTAAAVESEPAVAAGLAAARAELLERRHPHTAMPFSVPPQQQQLQQQLQQQADLSPTPLQPPQLQHPPAQHHQRGREEPLDTAAVAASAAAAAKDPKYRALVVDLLGEDALEDASNSSLDRGATTQETLQQQLQQLQQQQQLLQHEHLQLQQQQLEMQEKEQALARASAAVEGPVDSNNTAALGSSDLQQQEQQQQQLQVSEPAADQAVAVASPEAAVAAAAGGNAPLEQQQRVDAAAAAAVPVAGDAAAATEGRKHKSKKQKHKHAQRNQQQLVQQEPQDVQLQQEASAGFQLPNAGVLQVLQQGDSAAAPGYAAAAGTEEAAAAAATAAAAVFAAAPAGASQADSGAVPAGSSGLSASLTDASPFPAAVSSQHGEATVAAAAAAAATTTGAEGSSLLPIASLGDSPRLCDIVEAPPAEILKAMGVKDVPVLPAPAAAAAAAAPVSSVPAAVPLAAADAAFTGLPPAADAAAAVSGTWLAGMTPSQLSAVPGAAATAAAPAAAAAAGMSGHTGVEPPLLAPPVDGVMGALQMQHGASLHDQQPQQPLLQLQQPLLLQQQKSTREDLLPPKLRLALESTRRKGPPPKLLLLPWRGRGNGPIPEGYARPPPSAATGSAAAAAAAPAAAAAASGGSTTAEPAADGDASDRSVKRETTQVDSVTASAEAEAAAEASQPVAAAAAAVEKGSSSKEQRQRVFLRLRVSSSTRRLAATRVKDVPRNVFCVEDDDTETEPMAVDSAREADAAAAAAAATGEAAAATAAKSSATAEDATTWDAAQTKLTLAAAAATAAAAEAAAAQGSSTAHVLRLLSRVSQLPEGIDIQNVRTALQQCGFVRHALSRCCSSRRSCSAINGSNISNGCNSSSSSNGGCAGVELWLQQQTVRIQPVGPLTAILGDTADCSFPVSVSLLRCISLSSAAASVAAAIPLLLHLKLQGADAAAAALAAKGEYLVSPYFQLAASAAAAGGERPLASGGLAPPAAAAAAALASSAAASAAGSIGGAAIQRSSCCCSGLQGMQQNGARVLAGRAIFSLERQAIRNLPRRLLEDAQLKKQRREENINNCLLGGAWSSPPKKTLAHALGEGMLQLVLRAAEAAGAGDELGSSSSSSSSSKSHSNTSEECLSEGLRFVEDLNLWAAALPSELLLPVLQQQHLQPQQRSRMLRLSAVDVLLLHSEPLGLVTLSKPRASSSSTTSSADGSAVAAAAAAVCRAADGLRSSEEELPLQVKTEAPSELTIRKKRPSGDRDNGGTTPGSSSSSSSSRCCCCCCCFLMGAAVPPVVEPLQAALCLG
ncbi:bromodomain-containing protein, putative [Eimeria praecox]|uniref:Bromodomain-containing protein, putative n=1 Tax=Eimeria praecox TaxID=51316 RepID=U6H4F2_9EIME|nr:bromodomain-containing protein, putative [Eimeria praecox]